MSFRQNNVEQPTQYKAFVLWRETMRHNFELMKLPSTVLETRDDWQYFVDYSFHDVGNWRSPTFTCIDACADEFTEEQNVAFELAKESWLVECEKFPLLGRRV